MISGKLPTKCHWQFEEQATHTLNPSNPQHKLINNQCHIAWSGKRWHWNGIGRIGCHQAAHIRLRRSIAIVIVFIVTTKPIANVIVAATAHTKATTQRARQWWRRWIQPQRAETAQVRWRNLEYSQCRVLSLVGGWRRRPSGTSEN